MRVVDSEPLLSPRNRSCLLFPMALKAAMTRVMLQGMLKEKICGFPGSRSSRGSCLHLPAPACTRNVPIRVQAGVFGH